MVIFLTLFSGGQAAALDHVLVDYFLLAAAQLHTYYTPWSLHRCDHGSSPPVLSLRTDGLWLRRSRPG